MAYFQDDQEENKNTQGMNQTQQQPGDESQQTQLSTGVNTAQPGASTPAAQKPKNNASGQSSFQNYQKANQGAATTNLANAASRNVTNQAQTAKTGINQANQQFQSQVDQGSLKNRDTALADVKATVDAARGITAAPRPAQQQAPVGAQVGLAQGSPSNPNFNKNSTDSVLGSTPNWQQLSDNLNSITERSNGPINVNAPSENRAVAGGGGTVNGVVQTPNLNKNSSTQAQQTQTATQTNNPLSSLDQNQVTRFQDVINAKYQGPESLRQAGLYQQAQKVVDPAAQAVQNAKSAQGREQLLNSMFSQGGNYSQGLNKLDASLLNSSQAGVANLNQAAQNAGDLRQLLDQAQIGSANMSQNRANEITGIRNQARDAFTQGKTAEETATDARIQGVVDNWENLPNHFRDVISKAAENNPKIRAEMEQAFAQKYGDINSYASAVEAAQRNLYEARGMANLANDPSLFGEFGIYQDPSQVAEANAKMAEAQAAYDQAIGRQKEAQSAYAPLQNFNDKAVYFSPEEAAILGLQNGEGFYNLGADAIKSGVADKERLISRDEQARQAALAALGGLDQSGLLSTNLKYANADLAGTQSAKDALDLAATRAGLNAAEQQFQTDALGNTITGYGQKKNKTSGKTYSASESANLGDLLKQAGYQFGDVGSRSAPSNSQALDAAIHLASIQQLAEPTTALDPYLDNSSMYDKALNAGVDSATLGGSALLRQLGIDYGAGKAMPDLITGGATAAMRGIGLDIPGVSNFGNIFGSGASSAESKADAAGFARADLQNKVQQALDASGFQNRANVARNDVTNSRLNALQQLLAGLDKTNA